MDYKTDSDPATLIQVGTELAIMLELPSSTKSDLSSRFYDWLAPIFKYEISSLVYEIILLVMCVEASLDYGRLRRPGKLMIKNKTLGGSDAPNITSSYRRRTLQVGKLRPPTAGGTSKVCKTLHAHVRMHGHQ